MSNKKSKGTSGEAPIHQKQLNDTTPGSKAQWLAEFLFNCIGDFEAPIKRPKNPSVDRKFRELIEKANNKDDVIINDGAGYYRPRRGDGFDEHCYERYRAKELARAKAITDKIAAMDRTFYGGGNQWESEY